ncbi:hypothetical protein [Nocardioides sp.]
MYDLYPEWGPAKHRRDGDPTGHTAPARDAVQRALDLRDGSVERPDDN